MSSASFETSLFLQANDFVLYLLLLWLPFFYLLFPVLDRCVPDTTYCVEYYTQKDENCAFHSSKYEEPHHLKTQQLMESVSPLFTTSEISRKTQQTIQIVRFKVQHQTSRRKTQELGMRTYCAKNTSKSAYDGGCQGWVAQRAEEQAVI